MSAEIDQLFLDSFGAVKPKISPEKPLNKKYVY